MPDGARSHIVSRDGTRIAWYSRGAASEDGARPPVILTNGLGSTAGFWTTLASTLAHDHRVVHWDYRGHGDSEVSRTNDYAISTQADDLRRVAEAAGGPAIHVAFSMGVTVLLELYRRHPDLVRAMVLIAGGADYPYATSLVFRVPGVHAALRAWLHAAAPVVPHLRPLTRRLARSRALFPMGRAFGALAPSAPRDELEHFFQAVGEMDPAAYWATLRALVEAHASDVLPHISVPVLIVAAGHDVMAPHSDLEQLRDSIPGAKWLEVPATGHAVLLEAGDSVARGVREFLRLNGPVARG
jgi:pimeloyl-ACP methyl ester carboxylesterase